MAPRVVRPGLDKELGKPLSNAGAHRVVAVINTGLFGQREQTEVSGTELKNPETDSHTCSIGGFCFVFF